MKVSELRALLARCEEDADVYLVTQERGPHESLIAGVVTRAEVVALERADEAKDPDDRRYSHDRWTQRDEDLPQTDVFIVEARHVRYASSNALEVAVSKK